MRASLLSALLLTASAVALPLGGRDTTVDHAALAIRSPTNSGTANHEPFTAIAETAPLEAERVHALEARDPGLFDTVKGVGGKVWNTAKGAVDTVGGTVGKVGGKVYDTAGNVVGASGGVAGKVKGKVVDTAGNVVDTVGGAVGKVGRKVWDIVSR